MKLSKFKALKDEFNGWNYLKSIDSHTHTHRTNVGPSFPHITGNQSATDSTGMTLPPEETRRVFNSHLLTCHPHVQLPLLSPTHLSSRLVVLYWCHGPLWCQEDRNLHGWSPMWLIASLAGTLISQLKMTCHFLNHLSIRFPRVFCHYASCVMHTHMLERRAGVLATGRPPNNSLKKTERFCSLPFYWGINSSLLASQTSRLEVMSQDSQRHTSLFQM